jgi:hypothetical protein
MLDKAVEKGHIVGQVYWIYSQFHLFQNTHNLREANRN